MASLNVYVLSVLCMCSFGLVFSRDAKDDPKTDHLLYYEDILEAQKDKSVLIIDIREDYEVQETGKLPGSIHIPMAQVIDVLAKYSNEEFEKRYNRKKPTFDTKIILSCLRGIRSGKLLPKLLESGYKNTYSYAGGWNDWIKHQKN